MHPQYDFISAHREDMVNQTKQQQLVRDMFANQPGLGGKMLARLGDVLIASGSWLKVKYRSPIDEKSVSYLQQY